MLLPAPTPWILTYDNDLCSTLLDHYCVTFTEPGQINQTLCVFASTRGPKVICAKGVTGFYLYVIVVSIFSRH